MTKYQRLKTELINYRGGRCWKCGETELSVLQFHHVGRKRFRISRELWKIVFKKPGAIAFRCLIDEAHKCCVLCASCHAKVHAGKLEV